jgi:Putative zinc-finger
MMHAHIENQENIERYIRNQLAPEERQAFEEHFFSCEECFEKVQATERFIAGVRDAAGRGLLGIGLPEAAPARKWAAWVVPSMAASILAAVILALMSSWLAFIQLPKLRQQLDKTSADLRLQQGEQATLEKQIAAENQAEGNLPLVMLQATRDVQAAPNEVVVPAGAKHLIVWIEVPTRSFKNFRMQVNTADDRPIETLDGLKRNAYGALAASLPLELLQPGEYRIKLTSPEASPALLLGEYRLRIRRR